MDEQFKAFQTQGERYFERRPYGLVGKFDPKTSRYRYRVSVFEDPPVRIGVIIGDFAHNASSALEHLAWQLVCLNGKKPIAGRTGFPIFETRRRWNGKRGGAWLMQGMSPLHKAEIEALQPYHGGDSAPWEPLAVLRRLWNIDKHRVLHTTVGTVRGFGANFTPVRDCDLTGNSKVNVGSFVNRKEVAWVKVVQTGPHPKVDIDLHLTIDVAFRDRPEVGPSLEGRSVTDALEGIRKAVSDIYYRFLLDFSA